VYYPTTDAGRDDLALKLTIFGFHPTQGKTQFKKVKLERMANDMSNGKFNWKRSSLQPVILDPAGEILGGHHRIVAACLAGIDLTTIPGPLPQVQLVAKNLRPVYAWIDVLPDV